MIEPFLITSNLFGYIDGSIPCSNPTVTTTSESSSVVTSNPYYQVWIVNDSHVRMIIISTVYEASFYINA
ncbi:hypothetical protein HanHA300_Chr00c0109g0711021 [Helianthus annuus]|nr:hypothetical protein HanHA89_Chr11g0410971 [Helianthus annuus]KAJ0638494.1 hypothetical protein HanHA300_Chr00c0109g0711021 [Helianthus annuus]KAJ0684211.1 hypothetical protein HanLR1_Chr11g0388671 [Helianthus annuus]